MAGTSQGNPENRAGGAARPPDRGGGQTPDRAPRRSGDRGRLDRIDAGDGEIPARRGALSRKARWCCRGSIPISTTRRGNRSAGFATHEANSPRLRRRTIRSSRCTRCCIDLGSRAATSKSGARRRCMAATCWSPRRCGHRTRPRNGIGGSPSPRSPRKFRGAMDDLAVIEAANPEMEALAIAVAMREARHLNKSAALVTPDRALARRVMAALGRWNLAFDDSGGDALMDTPAGIFARLAAETVAKQLEPSTLLALLKHPLCRLRGAPGAFKDTARGARTGALARHAAARRNERARGGLRTLPP